MDFEQDMLAAGMRMTDFAKDCADYTVLVKLYNPPNPRNIPEPSSLLRFLLGFTLAES